MHTWVFQTDVDPLVWSVLSLAAMVAGLLLVLRILLGKELWHKVVVEFIYGVLKWLFLLPFRLLYWMLRLLYLLFKRS